MEVMLAIGIFAIAVIALGRSVENIINAQVLKDEQEQVRRYLDGKMSEVEIGAVPVGDKVIVEEVKDFLPKAKVRIKRTPIKRRNEKDQEMFGLFLVEIELTWLSKGDEQSRKVSMYIYPEQR